MNTIKDGYLSAINWIDANPQKTFWYALGAFVLVAVVF